MKTKVAVPINASTVPGVLEQVDLAVKAGADVLEWRSDYLEGVGAELAGQVTSQILTRLDSKVELLVTSRDSLEGGAVALDLAVRVAVLVQAAACGAQYIDLEFVNYSKPHVRLAIDQALAEASRCRLILSAHDFDSPFEDIRALYRAMHQINPDAIAKIVYTPFHINDCFEALDVLHAAHSDVIVLCMGQAGWMSRILAPKLGGFLTFASVNAEGVTAPGQLTVEQYRTLYGPDTMNGDTELYGILADPVGHSMSPAIHNACFTRSGLNKRYLPCLVSGDLKHFTEFLDNLMARPWLHVRGFSVTIPHKVHALEYTHARRGQVEPLAQKIGAVNTLIFDADTGQPSAFNTDYAGAMDAICQTLGMTRRDMAGLHVAVLGAGGVSRAIVAGLADVGAHVCIYNRTVEKARALAHVFSCEYAGLDGLDRLDADLLINGTSLGMSPHVDTLPVPEAVLNPKMAVFDTVYNPLQTRLLKTAQAEGCAVVDGLAMFVGQAMAQFQLFTGQAGDPDLMREVVMTQLGRG
ncbi:MAG: shikimate dehydrogenase [Planctomycetes bacterium]|nr:shikimate dehydrogenase [Planctomycetota bacterium]